MKYLGVIMLALALTACHRDPHCGADVTVILETDGHLGENDHTYYEAVTAELKKDPAHVTNLRSSWDAQRSMDNKAAFITLNLVGQQHEADGFVHSVVEHTPVMPYMRSYIIGPCQTTVGEAIWERHFAGQAPGQIPLGKGWGRGERA